ncbi:MAG: hypothetical protein Q7T05_02545 [Dehalococcoidia bacterium]|nr:hypothetical protein [Dehalococcoidia bacterium]
MLSRTCPNSVMHFLHPSQLYCKDCGATSVVRDHYTCQRCGWSTWTPKAQVKCPICSADVFEPALAVADPLLA